MDNVWLAFGLTTIAGLSTGIGSAIGFFAKRTNTKFLSFSLGFSAGVMIFVSMIEIYPKAQTVLSSELGSRSGGWVTAIAFFAGILLIAVIDKLIPSAENPHEMHRVEELCEDGVCSSETNLLRTGVFTALAVAIHNFPEGIATFVSALQEPSIAIPITVAIAIHNIPEGIAVSVPIFYATGSKKKAFLYSFLSGLSEPVGAIVAYLVLMPFLNAVVFGIIFAAVAGIMVFISLDELLPSARAYGEPHLSIYGSISGMAVMAVSLLLFI
ncbi:MAG: zinc transporter ZupT [Saccharofermentanales bacterium]|jgi:ZIP family zinc transporter|nr:zinc transporter ZupT [Clostridiaceae bacterium]